MFEAEKSNKSRAAEAAAKKKFRFLKKTIDWELRIH
jgi:hypothetical protein